MIRGNRHKYCVNPEYDKEVIVYKGLGVGIFYMNMFNKIYYWKEDSIIFLTDEELKDCTWELMI